MKRAKSRGTPAALVLAGGISRHGRSCWCRYCRAEYAVDESRAAAPDLVPGGAL